MKNGYDKSLVTGRISAPFSTIISFLSWRNRELSMYVCVTCLGCVITERVGGQAGTVSVCVDPAPSSALAGRMALLVSPFFSCPVRSEGF